MSDHLHLREYNGIEIANCVEALAELRMVVFRDWPYLYDGDLDYELNYLDAYVQSQHAFALVVYDDQRPVGATTALPLADNDDTLQQPVRDGGIDVERVFYFGESVLLPEYRGQGLYRRFFKARERHARSFGDYDWAAFCSVQRPAHHPARPPDHVPHDATWRRYGFEPRPDMIAHFPWRDIGEEIETHKPLEFWLKSLQ